MSFASHKTHMLLPRGDFSFKTDRVNQSLGVNNPLSADPMKPLFNLGLEHALITRRHRQTDNGRHLTTRHRFALLLEGSLIMAFNGMRHDVEPGQLAYHPPGTLLSVTHPGDCWYLYLTFNDHPAWATLKKRGPCVRDYESADLLHLLMERISDAYDTRSATALQFARNEATMLAELLRHEVTLAAQRPHRHETVLQGLVEAIKETPAENWTVADMAAKTHVSPRTLNRLFVRDFGLPPIELVVRERMAHAYHLIAETDMKIATVAQAVGYESLASFSRLFKKRIGTSPGRCRQEHLDG